MSMEQNKAIVRGYLEEVLNKGNLAAFDDYFSEDVVFNGSKGLRQQLDSMYSRLRKSSPICISPLRTKSLKETR